MSIFNLFRKKKKLNTPWAKYYTKEELNFEIPDITIYHQLKESALKYPENIAYEYEGTLVNFKTFLEQIDSASKSFYNLGLKKGDIVTICLPNVPEALISLYALNKIGVICSMLHTLSAEEEIKNSINSTQSRILIILEMFYSKIENIIGSTKVEKVIFTSAGDSLNILKKIAYNIININSFKRHPQNKFYTDWKKFIKTTSDNYKMDLTLGKNTPALILQSGGTSGKQKNIVLQNRSLILSVIQEKIALKRLKPGDSCLAIMPNFHGFGLSVTMHTPLCMGCRSILIPKFDATKFDILLKNTKPNIFLGVPTLFEALINNSSEKKLDLSTLKYVICGGDSLSKNLENRVNEYLKDHNSDALITQGYGLSEALAAVCLCSDGKIKPSSIGIPFPGNYIKIIDSNRNTLPYNEIGEICINTRGLMMGYLNDESETNNALQVHKDGYVWLHTGDLGSMDEDGFIYYQGRSKRMIISSGYNIYPSHIEEIIEKHPSVLQCSAVGIPHKYKQAVVKVFVVLKDEKHKLFIKKELLDYCKKHMSHYMIPYEFVIRKKLPKTKLGKVDFRKLQEDNGDDDE